MDALKQQVGGDHYKKLPIQPMEYSMANGLDACQHTIVKYVTRFRDKGGIADLEKARHTLDMLIEFERAKLQAPAPANDNNLHDMTKVIAMQKGDCPAVSVVELCGACKRSGMRRCVVATSWIKDHA